MTRQTIYVSSYPKSGSTWCTRLLGDVLDSPTGGCMPEEDTKEIATEGQNRPGPYIIRKGHFVLIDNDTGPVVPNPHRLAWKQLTDERIVFLVRDPRDICVSGAWHWQKPVEIFLDRMIKGEVARCGRWDKYNSKYLELFGWHNGIRYEDLLNDTKETIRYLLDYFVITDIQSSHINAAIARNTFESRKAQIGNDYQVLRRNNMRKGIAGDWRNHFTPAMNDLIWSEFGWMMERLNYVK